MVGVMAALLLIAALLSNRSGLEVSLLQQRAGDQWKYYDAKVLQGFLFEAFRDLAGPISKGEANSAQSKLHLEEKYTKSIDRYRDEAKAIGAEAQSLETEASFLELRGRRLYIAEVLLEIALVLSSLAMLTRQKWSWLAALLLGFAGVVSLVAAFV